MSNLLNSNNIFFDVHRAAPRQYDIRNENAAEEKRQLQGDIYSGNLAAGTDLRGNPDDIRHASSTGTQDLLLQRGFSRGRATPLSARNDPQIVSPSSVGYGDQDPAGFQQPVITPMEYTRNNDPDVAGLGHQSQFLQSFAGGPLLYEPEVSETVEAGNSAHDIAIPGERRSRSVSEQKVEESQRGNAQRDPGVEPSSMATIFEQQRSSAERRRAHEQKHQEDEQGQALCASIGSNRPDTDGSNGSRQSNAEAAGSGDPGPQTEPVLAGGGPVVAKTGEQAPVIFDLRVANGQGRQTEIYVQEYDFPDSSEEV